MIWNKNCNIFSKCTSNRPISVFIKSTESPEYEKLVEAFTASGYATKREKAACITIAFGGTISSHFITKFVLDTPAATSNTIMIGSNDSRVIRAGSSLR